MRNTFTLFLITFLAITCLPAQNGIIGTGFTDGWDTGDIVSFNAGMGTSRIVTLNSRQTGNAFFRLVRNWGGDLNQFGPFGCTDTDWSGGEESSYDNMSICNTSGAFFINTPNQTDNYVFKTATGGTSDDFVYFRVEGDIRDITSVSQSPASNMDAEVSSEAIVTASATFDGVLPTGQTAYLYYIAISTIDVNYLDTDVVPMTDTGDGLTYSAPIPAQPTGGFVSYAFFTSGDQVTPLATPEDVAYRAITFDDNGGLFYNYATNVALPVAFSDWRGNRDEQGVQLSWATATEQNASHFVLECSENDGRTWNERAQITARNAVSGANYRFLDQTAPSGSLQYRLRQVDFDGQFMYSNILTIRGEQTADLVSVYPQPAGAVVNVNVSDHFTGGQITLYDPAGRKVASQTITQPTAWLSTANLPSGVYLLRTVSPTDEVSVKRVVVR